MPEITITASVAFHATIVRESLRHLASPCAGFMLGSISTDKATAHFNFALPAITFPDYAGANIRNLRELPRFAQAAEGTARAFDRIILGLWAAWDVPMEFDDIREERHQSLMDQSRKMGFAFIATMSMCAREPLWPVRFWQCASYPHPPMLSSKHKGLRIDGPQDNPRRVKSEWRKQLAMHSLPIPGST